MMGGVSPETCWALYKYKIKFWYTVAFCWIFFVNYTMMHGSTRTSSFQMSIYFMTFAVFFLVTCYSSSYCQTSELSVKTSENFGDALQPSLSPPVPSSSCGSSPYVSGIVLWVVSSRSYIWIFCYA